jgi:sugar (pentulose or hexulose) kinase
MPFLIVYSSFLSLSPLTSFLLPVMAAPSAQRITYAIGLDIGTTSVKASLIERRTTSESTAGEGSSCSSKLLASQSQEHHAYSRGTGLRTDTIAQQHVPSILQAIDAAMHRLRSTAPADTFTRASHIGLSCQMHGVVLWRNEAKNDVAAMWDAPKRDDSAAASAEAPSSAKPLVSPLITWEDRRCTPAFLATLNAAAIRPADPTEPQLSGQMLSSGFGMASLAFFANEQRKAASADSNVAVSSHLFDLSHYTHAGTIGDFVAWLLSRTHAHVMDHTNAAAFGMYDMVSAQWQTERVVAAGIPLNLLPRLVPPAAPLGALCGRLAVRWGLADDATSAAARTMQVHACVGDHPASVYATDVREEELTISIGTSSQLSRVARTTRTVTATPPPADPASSSSAAAAGASTAAVAASSVERRPYICPFSQRTLLLCASLNGGNVLHSFVTGLERAARDVAALESDADSALLPLSDAEENQRTQRRVAALYARLIRDATALLNADNSAADTTAAAASSSLPVTSAHFFGERSSPDSRGSVSELSVPLFTPQQPLGGAAALFASLCRGVIANLRALAEGSTTVDPAGAPIDASDAAVGKATAVPAMLRDVRRIRCVGAAMQRNPLLARFVSEQFRMDPSQVHVAASTQQQQQQQQGDADAAHGAALLALDWAGVNEMLWKAQQRA